MGQNKLDNLQAYSRLYDFYAPLLSERQDKCFTMHYQEDLTMAEIGEMLGITPQAVAEQVKRTVIAMEDYEKKLNLIQVYQRRQDKLRHVGYLVNSLIDAGCHVEDLNALKAMLEGLEDE